MADFKLGLSTHRSTFTSNVPSEIPTIEAADVPAVTRAQMREIDRLMVEEFGIEIVQMMENAGLQLARLVQHLLGGALAGQRVLVLAGRGNNGGGGLVAARRLAAWGAEIAVILAHPEEEFDGLPAQHLDSARRSGVPINFRPAGLPPHDQIIDALIGYGLEGPPHGDAAHLIAAATASPAPIVSLDVPSGVDVDTGAAYDLSIHAAATLTLALPKVGLVRPEARSRVGDLYLADIGVPPALYEQIGLGTPRPFAIGQLVRVTGLP